MVPTPRRERRSPPYSGSAYILGEDNNFYALDAATGREKWKVGFARGGGSCDSVPVVRDGIVYLTGNVLLTPADANRSATYYRYLFALDANTGKERWRYPSAPQGGTGGICFYPTHRHGRHVLCRSGSNSVCGESDDWT